MDKNQLHEDDNDDDFELDNEHEDDGDDDRLESDQREAQEEGSDGNEENLRQQRRKRQKQRQKENMRKTRDENIILMRELAEAKERLAALEARNVNVDSYTAEQQVNDALYRLQMAELAHKEAIETGDGDKAVKALRMRDESLRKAQEANALKERIKSVVSTPTTPKLDARSESYAQNWVTENPWFNPSGEDEDSAIARAIDEAWSREALSKGITPSQEAYWDELDVRVKRRLGSAVDRRKKQVPPVSGRGEYSAPTISTRESSEIAKQRREALIKANIWDNPEERARYEKSFAEWDKANRSR